MSFSVDRKEKVEQAIRRIASEQIDKAIAEIDDTNLDQEQTVHQVRKRCKKLRGIIRLTRPSFEDTYKRENQIIKENARGLSGVRDVTALVEAYDTLLKHNCNQIDVEAYKPIRHFLVARGKARLDEATDMTEKLSDFRQFMLQTRKRVETWALEHEGYKTIAQGFKKTYRRGRKAMSQARNNPSTDNFHDWRKRVKYHGYHLKLLRMSWKPLVSLQAKQAKRLSDFLGDDHDLAILYRLLHDEIDHISNSEMVHSFLTLIERRREELQEESFLLGQRVFAEKPYALTKRYKAYWKAFRDQSTDSK